VAPIRRRPNGGLDRLSEHPLSLGLGADRSASDPGSVYDRLRNEIRRYSGALYEKPHLIVLTKRDLLASDDPMPPLRAATGVDVLAISSVAGTGLEELKEKLWAFVSKTREDERRREDAWTKSELPTSPWP
jgi:GTPase involved in cell partitioning and DNA repair